MKKFHPLSLIALLPLLLTSCSAKVPESIDFGTLKNADPIIHTDAQARYLADEKPSNINNYTGAGVVDESKSQPIELSWNTTVEGGDMPPSYIVSISEKEDFSDALTYRTSEMKYGVKNLKIHTKYYWKVAADYKSQQFETDTMTFTTDETPLRNMNIATLSNFRDLGGYLGINGKYIKQGMIYRSAEFNETYTTKTLLSNDDIKVMKEELKIKTDIDLRQTTSSSKGIETGGLSKSPLGDGVNYYNCPMIFQGSNVLDKSDNQDSVKQFFNYLADKNNYPIVFHCAQGKDRTGCMAYVIEALLGAGDESNDPLLRDYLFTNFSDVNGVCKVDDLMAGSKVGGVLEKEEGDNLAIKTFNHLMNKNGIPAETLNKVIANLLED